MQYSIEDLNDLNVTIDELSKGEIINTSGISDGYHTFEDLYHHRAILFASLCNQHKNIAFKSKKHSDGTMFNNMFIVGLILPEGQATYHYNIEPYWDIFKVPVKEFAPYFDGHTPDEAIKRIDHFFNSKSK